MSREMSDYGSVTGRPDGKVRETYDSGEIGRYTSKLVVHDSWGHSVLGTEGVTTRARHVLCTN